MRFLVSCLALWCAAALVGVVKGESSSVGVVNSNFASSCKNIRMDNRNNFMLADCTTDKGGIATNAATFALVFVLSNTDGQTTFDKDACSTSPANLAETQASLDSSSRSLSTRYFNDNCDSVVITPPLLSSNCYNSAHVFTWSVIDLSPIVSNINGVLKLNRAMCSATTPTLLPPSTTLNTDGQMISGTSLVSANQKYQASLQTDGNFVVSYKPTGNVIWSSKTLFKGGRLAMQSDCNLVAYQGVTSKWSSKTQGKGTNCKLVMQDDGNLVLSTDSGQSVWSTNTKGKLVELMSSEYGSSNSETVLSQLKQKILQA